MTGNCVITWQIAQNAHGCPVCEKAEALERAKLEQLTDRLLNSERITLNSGRVIDVFDVIQYATDRQSFAVAVMPIMVAMAGYDSGVFDRPALAKMREAIKAAVNELAREVVGDYTLIGGE